MAPSAERSSDPLAVPNEFGGDSARGVHPGWRTDGTGRGRPAGGVEGAEPAGGATVSGAAGAADGGEAAEGTHQAEDSGEVKAAWLPARPTLTATTDSSVTRSRTVNRRSG